MKQHATPIHDRAVFRGLLLLLLLAVAVTAAGVGTVGTNAWPRGQALDQVRGIA